MKHYADILHKTDIATLRSQLAELEKEMPELHAAIHAIALLVTRHSLRTGDSLHANLVEYGTKLGELVLSAAHSVVPSPGLARHLAEQVNAAAAFRELEGYVHKLGGEDPRMIDVSQFE